MITLKRFRRLEAAVVRAGYAETIDWSENIRLPADADAFARGAIYVIANSGMKTTVALLIYERCLDAIDQSASATTVFGHPGKATAIDFIWYNRERLFEEFLIAEDPVAFCQSLPWVGPVTCRHLAKNLGADVAKNDVHLQRLADRENVSVDELCQRLARQTGYRIATIDTILWRACESGILNSRLYLERGWRAAFDRSA
jgi:hypothetical protein